MKNIQAYLHTHWDYEWYFTAQESVIQFIYHMDEVIDALNSNRIDSYHLDSQMTILDEYFKYMPDKKDSVVKLIKDGKLIVGPWYTQTDQLVIDGESIIRNLGYGIKAAEELGDCMNIGYVPDSFGQSQDMPKIFNGFDIHRSLFWRGLSKDKCPNKEFIWKSEDGSEVLSYNIKEGYYFGGQIVDNDDVESVEKALLDGTTTQNVLLPIGGDQRYVDYDIQDRLDYYSNNTVNDAKYSQTTLPDFFDALSREAEDLVEVEGELIEPSNSKIHRSIYSSRYDFKYLNDKIERNLIYKLEPLHVMAMNLNLESKTTLIEQCWKKLLLNHAHDSACGCNSDKTNRCILNRLIETDQLVYSSIDYLVRKISESISGVEDNNLVVFNTLPIRRKVTSTISISTKFENFKIYDKDHNEVKYVVIDRRKENSGQIKKNPEDMDKDAFYYITDVVIDKYINPSSFELLFIEEDDIANVSIMPCDKNVIEDDNFVIELKDNGAISLTNKMTGEVINDFVAIEDMGDEGDTYDFSYDLNDEAHLFNFKDAKVSCSSSELTNVMKISGSFLLPENLEERLQGNSNVKQNYELEIVLNNTSQINFNLKIDNVVRDHRMRVVLATGIVSETSIADSCMGMVERDNTPVHMNDWKQIGYREEPSPIYPMIHMCGLADNSNSVFAFSKGIKEYEILNDTSIALTLFRSVGYLGKPDLNRRPGVASGNQFKYIATPDSQLLKLIHCKFAITFENDVDFNSLSNKFKAYAVDTAYYQKQDLNKFTTTLQYFVMHPLQKSVKPIDALIDATNVDGPTISSIVPIDNKSYAIRLVNLNHYGIPSGYITLKEYSNVCWVNLKNDFISDVKVENNQVFTGEFKPGQIKTLKVTL